MTEHQQPKFSGNRRQFLKKGAVALVALPLGAVVLNRIVRSILHHHQWAYELTGAPDAERVQKAWALLGKHYVRLFPTEGALVALQSGLEQKLGLKSGVGFEKPSLPLNSKRYFDELKISVDELRNRIEKAIIDDVRKDDVVSLDGWILSRTEAELYAFVSYFQGYT